MPWFIEVLNQFQWNLFEAQTPREQQHLSAGKEQEVAGAVTHTDTRQLNVEIWVCFGVAEWETSSISSIVSLLNKEVVWLRMSLVV